ncbi:lytic transglycosylase domain-containing protein [uncultured Prevotella sp.]|uniref:lytic transglycosylase domain-containing protein n=1 Tax=uncultured Prevotella sp. TaxID=159272 RepID=UPI0026204B83|nr:lytic transglycosylase domain-containing protein [uncultured Prevotella sp.]
MKKLNRKLITLALATLLCGTSSLYAQTDDDKEIKVKDKDGNEEVIDVPESMDTEFDDLLEEYYSKNYLKVDDNCNYRDENRTYEKEVYIDRLKRLPNIMEMPYNEIVQKFIDRYTGRLRRSVSYMLGASNFYMPIFEDALMAYDVPLELKYLPVIESALNPKATSRVGAAGLWQFMPSTGKQYGLEINSLVDERRDPVKSSYAAARFLRDLYKIYGDWSLVIAAYNCGPENVRKAIQRSNGKADYWSIYPYLPRETKGYVPAFIAANYVMTYYCDHNICPMRTTLPAKTDTVTVTRDVHLKQIADVCGVSLDELRALNPQYRRDIVNGNSKPSAIRLPISVVNSFISNEDSIYNYQADQLFTRRSLVEVDESVQPRSSYSRKSYSSSSSTGRSKKGKRNKKKYTRSKSVTIKNGDTLSEIAARHHTTVKKLRKLNGISGSNIRAGKKIKVK